MVAAGIASARDRCSTALCRALSLLQDDNVEMGYHYAAPLSLYAGWAVASGWPTLIKLFRRHLDRLGVGLVIAESVH